MSTQKIPTVPELENKVYSIFQAKALPSDIIELNTTIGSLTFNNLEIGKVYRIKMQAVIASPDNNNVSFYAIHDGVTLAHIGNEGENTNDDNVAAGVTSPAFVATATTVTFITTGMVVGGSTDTLAGNGTFSETWVELEEIVNGQLTTKWT